MAANIFCGVVLAGGASRRMGVDKADLKIGQTSLLEMMRNKLLDAGASKITVLGREDEYDGVADKSPGAGPATAITDHLKAQPIGSKHLFVPVDMPGLPIELLRKLAGSPGWSYFHNRYLPLLAIADGIEIAPPRRIQDLLLVKLATSLPWPPNIHSQFANLNNPTEFSQYIKAADISGSIRSNRCLT